MKQRYRKRGNNEGSIYQRKNGLWVASLSNGFDKDGKRLRKTFYGHSRSEVATKLLVALGQRMQSGQLAFIKESLQPLFMEWLLTFKKPTVSSRTFESIMSKAKLYILPEIGHLKINEANTNTLQCFLNKLAADDYAQDTIKKVKFLLSQFFEYAVDNQWLFNNPIRKVKIMTKDRNSFNVYKAIPLEKREPFIEIIKQHNFFKPLCMTMLLAGLRIGETLALKWSNINFSQKSIYVSSSLSTKTIFDSYGEILSRSTCISFTKTAASNREVPIPDILLEVLNEWKNKRLGLQSKTGISFCSADDLVFSNDKGMLRNYSATRKFFEKFLKKYNFYNQKITFHKLRHTYSTILFESTMNPKAIQLLLGHRDVTTTLKVYNSIDRSYFDKTREILNGFSSIFKL